MNRLYAICLLPEEIDRSVRFYKDILGLEINSSSEGFVDFKLGETSLALFQKDKAEAMFNKKYMNKGGGAIIVFQVNNLISFAEKLNDLATIIEKPKTTPWGQKVMYLLDPDQNIIEISEK